MLQQIDELCLLRGTLPEWFQNWRTGGVDRITGFSRLTSRYKDLLIVKIL
jgi:hypothetical protein